MSLKPTLPSERKSPVRHTIPQPVAREAGADEIITGTVRQVRNWSVMLWDDVECRWLSLPNQAQADLMQGCFDAKAKVRCTVNGMNIKEIEVL